MKPRPMRKSDVAKLRNAVVVDKEIYGITGNLLHNMTVRDVRKIRRSFEKHYGSKLKETDELFSDAAALFFIATKRDTGIRKEYQETLVGLVVSALQTFGSAVLLLRNGMGDQSLVLIRQVIEICSVVIHIVSDPSDVALEKFQIGNYHSTKSIGTAKKAIPLIGHFWGFLSETFVHINTHHSRIKPVKPYESGDEDVLAVLASLRMTAWVCYLTTELAFPNSRDENRYWKHKIHNGKQAVAFDPNDEEREWSARFLDLENVGAKDIEAPDIETATVRDSDPPGSSPSA